MQVVLIVGTIDTKREEILFIEKLIREKNFDTIIMDTGSGFASLDGVFKKFVSRIINAVDNFSSGKPRFSTKEEYLNLVISNGKKIINSLHKDKLINGVISIGGGTGTGISTSIMQSLPRGFPKLMVSTVATGTAQCGPMVGTNDITLMHSVVDLQGINFFTARIMANAVGAICGMVGAYQDKSIDNISSGRILVAMSMMGTTVKAALRAKLLLEQEGFQVISFHQNGTGGIAMEEMIEEGIFKGVYDLSIHEVGDRELGGLHGAIKPIRLETAGKKAIPQIVVPGCLVYRVDGPVESLSPETRKRKYFVHSPQLTLVRAMPEEMSNIGRIVAEKLNLSRGSVKVFIPLRGFCDPDRKGSELYDPEGNKAFINSLKRELDKRIPVMELDYHINDNRFIDIATGEFIEMLN